MLEFCYRLANLTLYTYRQNHLLLQGRLCKWQFHVVGIMQCQLWLTLTWGANWPFRCLDFPLSAFDHFLRFFALFRPLSAFDSFCIFFHFDGATLFWLQPGVQVIVVSGCFCMDLLWCMMVMVMVMVMVYLIGKICVQKRWIWSCGEKRPAQQRWYQSCARVAECPDQGNTKCKRRVWEEKRPTLKLKIRTAAVPPWLLSMQLLPCCIEGKGWKEKFKKNDILNIF